MINPVGEQKREERRTLIGPPLQSNNTRQALWLLVLTAPKK